LLVLSLLGVCSGICSQPSDDASRVQGCYASLRYLLSVVGSGVASDVLLLIMVQQLRSMHAFASFSVAAFTVCLVAFVVDSSRLVWRCCFETAWQQLHTLAVLEVGASHDLLFHDFVQQAFLLPVA
jgi:FlaA1/EpsC-like NDP-sugar epimerase